ncbi:hypothetical protein IMSAGC020_02751 [Lachnospiraceae bacterium]|nr:hypothetical protein IMSAGC020_02751 [Lachnospiraceae bacterium]
MIKLNWKEYGGKGSYQKNILYKISGDTIIPFTETHEGSADCERVDLRYLLHPGQYGIFAYEYRNPVISKQGCKTADVLTCVVDEGEKKITTFICDVKSNVSFYITRQRDSSRMKISELLPNDLRRRNLPRRRICWKACSRRNRLPFQSCWR